VSLFFHLYACLTSGHKDALPAAVEEPSLSEIVAAVIQDSSYPKATKTFRPVTDKSFRPPPEARYISNRNVYSKREGTMKLAEPYEPPLVPKDIELDSTQSNSNFNPPITFVSFSITPFDLHYSEVIVLH